jgi:hypothetical protein
MTRFQFPFVFRSMTAPEGRRRFGWHELNVDIEDMAPEQFELAVCSAPTRDSAQNVYLAEGGFWGSVSRPVGGLKRRVHGILSEDVCHEQFDPSIPNILSYMMLAYGASWATSAMVISARYYQYQSKMKNRPQLRTHEISNEDVAHFESWCQSNLRCVAGRLMWRAEQPFVMIGGLVNDLCCLRPYIEERCGVATFPFSPWDDIARIGPAFDYPDEAYHRYLRYVYNFDGDLRRVHEYDKHQSLIRSYLKDLGRDSDFVFTGSAGYNPEVLSRVEFPVCFAEKSLLHLGRKIVEKISNSRNLFQGRVDIRALKQSLSDFDADGCPAHLDKVALMIAELPYNEFSKDTAELSGMVLERWEDREIKTEQRLLPTARISP